MARSERRNRAAQPAVLAALALVLALAGCKPPEKQVEYATPGPTFRLDQFTTGADTVKAVLGYVERLDFDVPVGAGDEQVLHEPPRLEHGPVARIEPERGSWAIDPDSLVAGRVIARIVNDDTRGYRKFGIRPRSVTYWWVDSTSGEWRSVFVSSASGAPPVVSDLIIDDKHPANTWRQAVARWLWVPTDEAAWSSCDYSRCCRSSGSEITPS